MVRTELAAVVVSLVGYFFYIAAAFTLLMASLIGLFSDSTLHSVRHYQRPVIVATLTVETKAAWRTASATKAKPIRHVENSSVVAATSPPIVATASIPAVITAASIAKAAAAKTTRQKLAHVHKPKVLARARDSSSGPDYPIAFGYAEDPRYGPRASSFSKLPYLIQHGRRRR